MTFILLLEHYPLYLYTIDDVTGKFTVFTVDEFLNIKQCGIKCRHECKGDLTFNEPVYTSNNYEEFYNYCKVYNSISVL